MLTTEEVLTLLEDEGCLTMELGDEVVLIKFISYISTDKEYTFKKSSTPLKSCKNKRTATKYINQYLEQGFVLGEI